LRLIFDTCGTHGGHAKASIRKTESGWHQAVVRVHGYPTVPRVFRTRSQARVWAQRFEDDMRMGTWRQDAGGTWRM